MTWQESKRPILTPRGVENKAPKHHNAAFKHPTTTLTSPSFTPEKYQFHPYMLKAYGITNNDIHDTINTSEEPSKMLSMFKFLDLYSRLSDRTYKTSDNEIDSYISLIRHKMIGVIKFYEQQAYDPSNHNEREVLLKIVKKAVQLSKPVGNERIDRVIYMDTVANFGHTSGSVIPVIFDISDYGREDYWPRKLLDYLRRNKS